MQKISFWRRLLSTISLLIVIAYAQSGYAVPSFARQTGLECSVCHTSFPQLNAFGRQFKMSGYTLARSSTSNSSDGGFNLLAAAPLSMMLQTTMSKINTPPDEDTASTDVKFPSELSIFYAGRVTDKIGAFLQITAEEGESFSQDNTDIRFADIGELAGSSLIYGVSLNNNPTVQDPWNSTPVWSFPWFEAGYGYGTPDTMISSIGGGVTGLTAYGFWNNRLYAEIGAYKASNAGADLTANAIDNTAPYWRFAYTSNAGSLNWMLGTFGMKGKVYNPDQMTASITDSALDAQLQWMLPNSQIVTLNASYIHESQPDSQHLNSSMVNVTWDLNPKWAFIAGYRGSASSDDALAPNDDYRWENAGNLGSDSYQLQMSYMPWLNTRFALQYTTYSKLNGTSDNASDNNQLMIGAWMAF